MRKIATLATSQHIDAYGGHQISEELLNRFVDQLREPGFTFNMDHDPRQGIEVKVVRAWAERHDDGYLLVRAELDAPAEVWERVGDRVGVSISYAAPISLPDGTPAFDLTADAFWFDEGALRDSGAAFARRGYNVSVQALYQFNQDPDAWIFLTLMLDQIKAIPSGVISAMIWDAVKPLLSRFRSHRRVAAAPSSAGTKMQFELRFPDGANAVAHVDTDSDEIARQSIDEFMKVIGRHLEASPAGESDAAQ